MERRRRLLERGRVGVSRHQQVPMPPQPRAPGPSQGPAHGQGSGIGLQLLALGKPGNGTPGKANVFQPTFEASATTPRPGAGVSSLAVNLPAYVAGNIVVVNLCGRFSTSTDTASAPGWTADGVVPSGQRILFGFHRRMDGTEGSTVTFTFSTNLEQPFAVTATYAFASSVEASKPTSLQNPVSSWACGPITTTGPNRRVIALAFEATGSAGTDFGAVTNPGVAEAHYLDPVFGNEAALIADLTAATGGTYSMGGALTGAATAFSILIGLAP